MNSWVLAPELQKICFMVIQLIDSFMEWIASAKCT